MPLRVDLTSYAHRESAIQRGLKKRLEQLADERERRQRAAEKADEEFSLEFLNARPGVRILCVIARGAPPPRDANGCNTHVG